MSSQMPLREKAYERIRAELLVAGPRAFGGRLVEQQLAVELDMSRTPVRDALQRLAVIGVVEEVPGGGFVPRQPRLRDVREQYALRLLLECKAAELAASRPPADREAALRTIDAAADAIDGSRFHAAVADAADNQVLANSIATLNERSFLLRLSGIVSEENRGRLRGDHNRILTAVRAGETAAAVEAMRAHLIAARELATAAVQELRRDSAGRP